MVEADLLGKRVQRKHSDLAGVVTGLRNPMGPTDEDDRDRVATGIAIGARVGVELHKIIDGEGRLLEDLSLAGCLERLAQLDEAPRQGPAERFESPPHEKNHPRFDLDDRVNRNQGSGDGSKVASAMRAAFHVVNQIPLRAASTRTSLRRNGA
jgi:hypothetical protein